MPDGGLISIPLALTAAAAVAGTAYQIKSSEDAKSAGEAANKKAQMQADQLIQEQKDQTAKINADQARAESTAAALATRTQQMQRNKNAKGVGGRAGTILTSPLGVIGDAPSIGKTLLGQ